MIVLLLLLLLRHFRSLFAVVRRLIRRHRRRLRRGDRHVAPRPFVPLRKDALLLLLLVQLWPLHFVPRLIDDQSTSRNITSFLPPLLSLSLALTAARRRRRKAHLSLARSPFLSADGGGLHLLARPSFDSGGARLAPSRVRVEEKWTAGTATAATEVGGWQDRRKAEGGRRKGRQVEAPARTPRLPLR